MIQNDGNFVLYNKDTNSIKWTTVINPNRSPPYLIQMQADGNLVIYDNNHTVCWASNT